MATSDEAFQDLLQRIRNGDEAAAQQLVTDYGPHILRVVRRRLIRQLRNQFDSVDFEQSVWGTFFQTPPDQCTFDSPEALIAYLENMARNKVIRAYRRNLKTQKRDFGNIKSLDKPGPTQASRVPAQQPTPSQCAIADDQFRQMLQRLPPQQQRVLCLLRLGYTPQEAAQQVGVHIKTVRRLVDQLSLRTDR
jgi:RNA polymerase sigma-70 factor (ECF subfamily)